MYRFPEAFEATFKYQQNKFLFRDSNSSKHRVNSRAHFITLGIRTIKLLLTC